MVDSGAKVLRAIEGGPAEKSGIVVDDVITHVDGEPLAGLPIYQMLAKLRGPVESTARLQIVRKDQAIPIEVAVVRDTNRAVLEDSVFYVDARYHTQIAFTKDGSGRVSNPNQWLVDSKAVRSALSLQYHRTHVWLH
jgi:C-terminal processing protease CtpA/Prc